MKKLFLILTAAAVLGACATPYQRAGKENGKGFFDKKLQEGMYSVSFNGNEETSVKMADDYALLRSAEVCLENGYQSFEIVSRADDSKEKQSSTIGINGIIITATSSKMVVTETIPKITLVVRCSKALDLPFKAQELKTNLKAQYKLM